MLPSLQQRISRLSVAAFFVASGLTSFALGQGNSSCIDSCSKKCSSDCSTLPSASSCCPNAESVLPNPESILPSPSPLDMDPSTRPLTMPDPADPNAAPNANPPGDAFAFSPLQSSLSTPDQVGVPNMMGNLLRAYRGITFQYLQAGDFAISNTSGSVTFRNSKIAENNSAIPRDRIGVRYNYFRNALTVRGLQNTPPRGVPGTGNPGTPFTGFPSNVFDLDAIAAFAGEGRVARGVGLNGGVPAPTLLPGVRAAAKDYDVHLYTFEVEKTFLDGLASIGVRVPFADGLGEDQDFTAGVVQEDFLISATGDRTLGTSGGEWQDIQLILKGILRQDPTNRLTISGGLGLTLPTGPNLNASVADYSGDDAGDSPPDIIGTPRPGFAFDMRIRDFIVQNETFELSPFLAMAQQPTNRTFINGFAQIDIPLNESDWTYRSHDVDIEALGVFGASLANSTQTVEQFEGSIRDQTLLHLDIGGGYWLYQNPYARSITGLAVFTELHYSTTLQDADIVTVPAKRLSAQTGLPAEPAPRIGNIANRIDILDVTLGTHIQIGQRATLAVGGVLPLRDGDDRTFDVEVNAQLNLYR